MAQNIFFLPDPQTVLLNRLVAQAQVGRFRRQEREHFEGIEDEAADKKLTGLIGGAVIGGVGAFALGGTAAAAATATTAATAAVPASLATIAGGALVGSQAGSQIAGGDIAGGVATAAGGIAQGIQGKAEREQFGFNLTDADRKSFSKRVQKLGMVESDVLRKAKLAGLGPIPYLDSVEQGAASADEIKDMADELDVSVGALKEAAGIHGDDLNAGAQTIRDLNTARDRQNAVQLQTAKQEAEYETNRRHLIQNKTMEVGFDKDQQNQYLTLQSQKEDLVDAVNRGEVTPEQYPNVLAEINRKQKSLLQRQSLQPRKTPFNEATDQETSSKIVRTPSGNVLSITPYSLTSKGDARPGVTSDAKAIQEADRIARRQQGGGGGGLGDVFEEAGSLRSMDAFNKAATTLAILKGGEAPTNDEVFEFMRKQQAGIQAEMGGAAPPVTQPATAQPQAAPQAAVQRQAPQSRVAQQVAQTHQAFVEQIAKQPVSTWTPQQLQQMQAPLNAAIENITQGATSGTLPLTDETAAMLQDFINIKKQILAQQKLKGTGN